MLSSHYLLLLIGFLAIGAKAQSTIDCVARPYWWIIAWRSNPSSSDAEKVVSYDDQTGVAGNFSDAEKREVAEVMIRSLIAQGPSVVDELNDGAEYQVNLKELVFLVNDAVYLKSKNSTVTILVGGSFIAMQLVVRCGTYQIGVQLHSYPTISK